MKRFVFATGLMNVLGGILFAVPDALLLVGIEAPANRFWLLLPALFLAFLGVILIFSSRDLANRATIVFWDGFSRVTAFFVFLWFGLCAGMGNMVALLGIVDLAVALVYFVGLPRALDRGFLSILLDRHGTAG
ncbi:MAG: hypothetical protein HPY65_05145 [Syntrophaceae bacterium]|nr:hypothetical protein [Syntrophaceae bacterium]